MKVTFTLLLLALAIGYVSGQTGSPVHVTDHNTEHSFGIIENTGEFKDDLTYTWYSGKKLFTTTGAATGNLVHGKYVRKILGGNLAETGTFRFGLKHGTWYTWTDQGKMSSKKEWRKGKLHGLSVIFDDNGLPVMELKYRNGELQGKCNWYRGKEIFESCRFRKGREVSE